MLPQIRYTKTADGVAIAFWERGEGPPIVVMPATPFSHIQLEWEMPGSRRWLQALGGGRRLVRYDGRGFGLSGRDADDFTAEAQCRDLDAVAEALGLECFALFASGDSGMTAITYAATRPQRVSHLVLWCSWARRTDVSGDVRTRTLRNLVEQDWEIYTETAARVLLGWNTGDAAREFAAFYREAADPAVLLRAMPAVYATDTTPLLPRVAAPTLVLHRRSLPAVDVQVAREIAAGIPGARLVILEGSSPLPFLGSDMEQLVATIHEFLGDDVAGAPELRHGRDAAPVTILFTDMEGSTALTQRLGDAAAQQRLHVHDRIVRRAVAAHDGTEVKHTGDGLMVSFPSATRALECAVAIQQRVDEYGGQHPDTPIAVRIGLNAGEPLAEAGDYFGTAVQLAARICDQAVGGQILVSGVVRDLAAGKGFLFSDLGETVLRGFEDPVRLYQVRW